MGGLGGRDHGYGRGHKEGRREREKELARRHVAIGEVLDRGLHPDQALREGLLEGLVASELHHQTPLPAITPRSASAMASGDF